MDREMLEREALRVVSAENYYELEDYLDTTTDAELEGIIKANGNPYIENRIGDA